MRLWKILPPRGFAGEPRRMCGSGQVQVQVVRNVPATAAERTRLWRSVFSQEWLQVRAMRHAARESGACGGA